MVLSFSLWDLDSLWHTYGCEKMKNVQNINGKLNRYRSLQIRKFRRLFINGMLILFILLLFFNIAFASNSNLIANPSVEEGIGSPLYWNSGSNAYWSSDGCMGIHSIALNPNNADGEWRSDHFNVTENQKHQFSFWVKGTYTSGEFYVNLRWFSDYEATQFISQIPYRIWGSYSSWTNVNDTVTSPSNAKSCDVRFNAESGTTGDIKTDDYALVPIIVTIEPNAWKQFFFEFLFGSASWIGLIVILCIMLPVVSKWKYAGIVFLPITVLLAVEYFLFNLGWQGVIMLFGTIYIAFCLAGMIRERD